MKLVAAICMAVVACGDNVLHSTLVRVDQEPPGTNCSAGGVAVNSGVDKDGDGVLENGEITTTDYVCSAASTLVRVVPEAPGASCANGGLAVESGVDANGDHVLEDAEVLATSYVCNGGSGATQLVRVDTEPPGANCADGGSAILIGPDTNGNGTLDDTEVTATTYMCNGASTVIRIAPEPAGANCQNGGFAILSGQDTNDNGILDDAEVTATAYACNAPAPPIVRVFFSGTNDNWPEVGVKAPAGTTIRVYTDPACIGSVVFTAPGGLATRTFRAEVPDNTALRFYANATSTWGTSACAASATAAVENSSLPPGGGAATCAARAGGASTTGAMAVAVAADADGSLVVAGYFQGPFVLGQDELGETTLAATSGVYVARYRADCTLAWAREIAGPSAPAYGTGGLGVSVASGAITVAGTFGGSATFGPGEPRETTLTAVAGSDGFVARFGSDGALSWARQQLGGGATLQVMGLASSKVDTSFFVAGWFDGAATFGPGEPNETSFTSATNGTMFLARFRDDGSLMWVSAAGETTGWAEATAVTALGDGGAAITGAVHGSVTFGAGEPNQTTLTSHYNGADVDVIVVRYDSDGTLAWAKQAGNQGEHMGWGIAASLDGSELTVTGTFGSSVELGYIEFGAGEPNDVVLGSEPFYSAFVARFQTVDGSFLWARQVQSDNGGESGQTVAPTSDGGAIVAGRYGTSSTYEITTFAPGEPNVTTLLSQGYDVFIARYTSSGQLAWVRDVWGPTDNDAAYGVAVSADDSATLVGRFRTHAVVDTASYGAPRFSSSGYQDAFVARFGP